MKYTLPLNVTCGDETRQGLADFDYLSVAVSDLLVEFEPFF